MFQCTSHCYIPLSEYCCAILLCNLTINVALTFFVPLLSLLGGSLQMPLHAASTQSFPSIIWLIESFFCSAGQWDFFVMLNVNKSIQKQRRITDSMLTNYCKRELFTTFIWYLKFTQMVLSAVSGHRKCKFWQLFAFTLERLTQSRSRLRCVNVYNVS